MDKNVMKYAGNSTAPGNEKKKYRRGKIDAFSSTICILLLYFSELTADTRSMLHTIHPRNT